LPKAHRQTFVKTEDAALIAAAIQALSTPIQSILESIKEWVNGSISQSVDPWAGSLRDKYLRHPPFLADS
jgi:hypothetical protein